MTTVTTLTVIVIGVLLTISPFADTLGFTTLPRQFFGVLVLLTVAYLILVDVTNKMFYADLVGLVGPPHRVRGREHRIQRRTARSSHGGTIHDT